MAGRRRAPIWPVWKRVGALACLVASSAALYLGALEIDAIARQPRPEPYSPQELSRRTVWLSADFDPPQKALQSYESHLKSYPSDLVMRLQCAALYEKEGHPATALAHYQAVRRDDPRNLEAATGAARCYAALDRHDLAALEWEAAARLAPKDAKVQREMGLALYRSGDSLRAMDALYQSLALDPDQSDLHALISEIAMGGGPRGPAAGGDEAAFAPPFAAAFQGEGQIAPRAALRPIDPARYGLTSARNSFDAPRRSAGPRAVPHPRF